MTKPAIEVTGLGKSYVLKRGGNKADKTIWVLKDINFTAEPGDVIGIVGKNGAGKSTLLKILARITEPSEGRAVIRGRVASLLEVGTGFHDELSGRENVYMNGTLLGLRPDEVRKRFDEIVAFSGVERFIDQPVKHFSSGMRVRLAFSVAAFLDPEVLFIDEVLSVGDMEFQDRCLKRMNQLTTEFGRTVLFVSHNMGAVATLCPKAILLNQGTCIAQGPTGQIVKQYHELVHGKKEQKELGLREDRTGTDTFRFTRIELQNEQGQPVEFGRSGSHLRLALSYRYEDTIQPGQRVVFSVAFCNARGHRLFATPSDVIGKTQIPLRHEGQVFVDIPDLPLQPGRYEIDIACLVDRLTVDKVKGAAVVPVVEGSYYPGGRLPNSISGDMLVRFDWSADPLNAKPKAPAVSVKALRPVEDIADPVAEGTLARLQAIAPVIYAIETKLAFLIERREPIEAAEYDQLASWRTGYAERLKAIAAVESDDGKAKTLLDKLQAALERIGRQLGDAELAMLLGVPVPEDQMMRGIAVNDYRLVEKPKPLQAIGQLGRPIEALAGFVRSARADWRGSANQRRGLQLIVKRANGFRQRADEVLARVPDNHEVEVVHEKIGFALTEMRDWIDYLLRAPEDATGDEDALFQAYHGASRIRDLHLSQLFRGIDDVAIPISAINQESGQENQVDLLYVSAIAKALGAKRIFEFGTYLGRTSWHLAATAPDAEVWTLNLPPEADARIAPLLGTFYRGTPEAERIHEVWIDSRKFEPGELAGTMDLVFIDADHSYDAVRNDTEKALALLKPGGVVLWHDYAAKSPGVVRFGRDFALKRPLFRIKHTALMCLIDGVKPDTFEPAPMRRGLGD